MGAVTASCDKAAFGPFPVRSDIAASGEISTAAVVAGADRPLLMSMHRMQPGSSLTWDRPPRDHLLYVWEGGIETDRGPLVKGEALLLEHGARGAVRSSGEPAVVVHFECAETMPAPGKAGGRSRAIRHADIPHGKDPLLKGGSHQLYADSGCETCDIWFHASHFPGLFRSSRHYHTEDEIILVTAGEMRLGRVGYGPGAALAIDADTRYTFAAGENGLSIVNFKPSHPWYIVADDSAPPLDERANMLDVIAGRTVAGAIMPD